MTLEMALSVAGPVLVSGLVWQLHRIVRRQLSEIRGEVNALQDVVSRVFLTQLNHKSENEPSISDVTPRPPYDPASNTDRRDNDALQQLQMEFEVAEIDGLCAKLITLAPPIEAAPLLPPARPPSEARERLRPWPQSMARGWDSRSGSQPFPRV
jgi:hypothetical protein